MKPRNIQVILATLSLLSGFGLPGLSAPQDKSSTPTSEDLKQSRDRGIHFSDLKGGNITGVTEVSVTRTDPKRGVQLAPRTGVSRTPNKSATSKGAKATRPTTPSNQRITGSPKTDAPSQLTTTGPGDSSPSADARPVSFVQPVVDCVVKARLNKDGLEPRYRIGEKMEVLVTASTDCNLTVFDYDSQGTLTQIFPNDFQQNGFVKAGESVHIGGTDSPFEYEVAGKGGTEKVFVYAYPTGTPNPLTVAFNPVPQSPFRATALTVEQYRELVKGARVFFDRGVAVAPKSKLKQPAAAKGAAPNKVELSYVVESK